MQDKPKTVDEILALHMPIDLHHFEDAAGIKTALKQLLLDAKPTTYPSNISTETTEYIDRVIDQYEQNITTLFGDKE